MMRSARFLGSYYLRILAALAVFWAAVLFGLWVTQDMNSLFGNYYRMFPMVVGILIGVYTMSQGNCINIALGMNAGRSELYWAGQLMIAGLVLISALLTAAMWLLGEQMGLESGYFHPYLGAILPISACCLALGEGGLLVSHAGTGVVRKVLIGVYIVLCILVCVSMVLIIFWADVAMINGIMTAVGLAITAVLAAIEFRLMRKAVVQA